MCGRYALTSPHDAAEHYGIGSVPEFARRYNIAPSQESLIVTSSNSSGADAPGSLGSAGSPVSPGAGTPKARLASWGFDLPAHGSARRRYVINARSEEVDRKPLFRSSFVERRCLVPANGFYEWMSIGKTKQPYYFSMTAPSLFSFAGLWRLDSADRPTYVILTTKANAVLDPIHDRMPVILKSDSYRAWLEPASLAEAEIEEMLRPWPAEQMTSWPVRMGVNRASFDDSTCIQPLEGPVDLFTY